MALSAILLMLAGGFFSCNNKEQPLEPFLMIDETPITIETAEAGTHSIAVSSNGTWTAVVENADWCTLNNSAGERDGVITVNVAKNTLFIARNATIKITSGSLTKSVVVSQNAAEEPEEEPFLEVDETPITATAEAGTYFIAVNSNNDWSAVVEDADWCTLNNGVGESDGVIIVNVAENTDYTPRSATVKITSGSLTKSVIVNQSPASTEEEYPIDVPFTEYFLPTCQWGDLGFNKLKVVNNNAELSDYIVCTDDNFPEIDFSKWTLLVFNVEHCNIDSYVENISLQQFLDNKYLLCVTVIPSITANAKPLIISILTPKISDDCHIELNVTTTTL